MLDDTPADDTPAQAQLRAAMARYMAAEGTQMLDDTPEDDTDAQAQLRAAMARYMVAEGTQMLDDTPEDDTDAQAQLRAAMARYMVAEGTQDIDAIRAKAAADRTVAEQELLDAVDRWMTAEARQTLPDDPADDTPAQAQLRAALGASGTATSQLQLLLVAQTSTTDANEAVDEAGQAVLDAEKYATDAMLKSQGVMGESKTAQENAQKVLDAKEAGDAAVKKAENAQKAAEEALERAKALDDGDIKTALVAALEKAIANAKAKITEAKAARDAKPSGADGATDPTRLTIAVRMVTGTDSDNLQDATDIGETVATDVETVFNTAGGAGIVAGSTPPATGATVKHDGMAISAMTWAQIVGDANIMKMRLGTIDDTGALTAGNEEVSVASLEGMTASDVAPTGTDFSTTGNTDGAATTGGMYMGILGAVVCLGGSDGCKVTDGKLGAGWYFSPAAPEELYVEGTGGDYMVATMYARYGYWLVDGDGDGVVDPTGGIATYAAAGAGTNTNTANLNLGTAAGSTDTSAEYTGDAVGISVHEVTDTNDRRQSIASGEFTARVTLTAKFGATPTLGGTVNNFRGVNNPAVVDPRWSVSLNESSLTAAAALGTDTGDGTTSGDSGAAAGVWTAQGYGPAPVDHDDDPNTAAQNQRPTGFFGTFSASFTDGAVAGGYATRR